MKTTSLPTTGVVETRIGQLRFEAGYPSDETIDKLYEEMDFQRAVQAYLWAIPLVSFAQWQEQHEQVFGAEDGDLVFYVSYRDKLGLLTSNATTPYLLGFPNLSRTGPLVIDVPAGQIAGAILDFWQRPVADLGLTGPDKGAGGKYLLLGPGQEVDDTSGYIVVQAPTNNILNGIRVLLPAPEEAKRLREAYQVYPYSKREDPPRTRIVTPGGKDWQGWQPGGLKYWKLVSKMLNDEPVHERDRMIVAMLKPLGIEKGKPFQPDARQKKILEEAAVVGEADPEWGQAVVAYLVLKQEGVDLGEILAFTRAPLGFKRPKRLYVLNELPKNAAGKIQKSALKPGMALRAGGETR